MSESDSREWRYMDQAFDERSPMTPEEFDRRCRWLEERLAGRVHQTSGTRSLEGNASASGAETSKHLYGMARDYKLATRHRSVDNTNAMLAIAKELGFWFKPNSWGVHLQGLPPGPIPRWWWDKYGKGAAAEAVGMVPWPEGDTGEV